MMDKRLTVVYSDAAEKFVKAVILYAKGNSGSLYYNAECTDAVNGAEVQNFFLKGLIVNVDGVLYNPIYCSVNESQAFVSITNGDDAIITYTTAFVVAE